MINAESLAAVQGAGFGEQFIRPLFDSYGFNRIPGTIERALSGQGGPALPPAALSGVDERYETVILIFLDSCGWRFFAPRVEQYPFLQRFVERGTVSQLTTMFPSTTSAHVTTIHTGLPPSASGVFEWFYYEPQLDAVIAPLLFALAGTGERETLKALGARPADLFPSDTIYRRLAVAGVGSTVFQHRSYARSSFSRVVCDGAQVVPFLTLPEALSNLSLRLENQRGSHYYMLYVDTIDTICHRYGPDSQVAAAEIDAVLTVLDRLLHPTLAARRSPTLLLLTADHGHVAIDPSRSIYVNQEVPALEQATRRTAAGRPLAPSGSRRDLFLYIEEPWLDEIVGTLTDALAGRAEVHRTADLAAANFFGGTPGPGLRGRMGNLVILPYPGETVWWHDPDWPSSHHRGSHGGLSRAEAETLIGALDYRW